MQTPPFITKGYYVPMVLCNGVDFCQIDFSGSMSWEEHIKGYVSYWYKKDRPRGPDPLGIVKPIYQLVTAHGPVQIGDFAQRFDPRTGTLATRVSMHRFAMEVVTLLAEDHTLAEHFRITECEDADATLRFGLYFANRTYTNKPLRTLDPARDEIAIHAPRDGVSSFGYRYGEAFVGLGISAITVLRGGAGEVGSDLFPETGERECNTMMGGMRVGDEFLRVTTLVDNLDAEDYESEARRINADYRERGWEHIWDKHASRWQSFHGLCEFQCEDEEIARQFALSSHVCRSSLHPGGSTVSALALPNNHGMGTYWDVWYVHRGLLNANRVEAASSIVRFWQGAYPGACDWAREKYGVEGARFAWVLGRDGTPVTDGEQIHNNIIPVLTAWDQYRYTQDRSVLENSYDMMEDCVRFVVRHALKKGGDGYYLKKLIGVDESGKRKRNELLTTIATARGIDIVKQSAAILSRTVSGDLLEAAPAFEAILQSLETDTGYAPYEDGDSGNWANALAFVHRPDPSRFRSAIDYALDGCSEACGLNVGRASRMRCCTFPWVEGIFTWAMLRNDDPRAKDYFRNMTRFTNFHGGFAEHIWRHGEPSRDWFVAAHGVYAITLTEFVAQMRGGCLTVLPLGVENLPFGAFSIRDMRVEGAWLVSAERTRERPLTVSVRNDLATDRSVEVLLPGRERETSRIAGYASGTWEVDVGNS